MKYSAALAVAAVAVGVQAQGEAIGKAPAGGSPPGCITTGSGYYQITVVQPSTAAKRSLERRAECGGEGTLVFEIKDGILTDRAGRIGSIVANRQFQFDGPPPQTGAIYTGGFSVCQNTSLAIGPTTNFYQCRSGGFFNLYDQPSESDCSIVKFNTIPCTISGSGGAVGGSSSAPASQQSDGQPTASSAVPVSSQPDGQPTAAPATSVVSQQPDGQPTASSAAPVVSQISDGQPQATNATVLPTSAAPTAPIATGAAAQFVASGAVAVVGAVAAFFL